MGELQLQIPRVQSPFCPPYPLFSQKPSSSSSTELVDFQENGFDFYPSPFDSSFPYRGIFLNNERTLSSTSPTSNASFLPETPFINGQSLLKTSSDSGLQSEGLGLLATTSTPFHGNDADPNNLLLENGRDVSIDMGVDGFLTPHENHFNNGPVLSPSPIGHVGHRWDSPKTANSTSNNHFDFSFPNSENSGNGSGSSNGSRNSNASADSPTRLTSLSSIPYAWDTTDASLEPSSECLGGSSMITTLGNSIWTPAEDSFKNNNRSNNVPRGEQLETMLGRLSKKQLLAFSNVLKEKYAELLQEEEISGAGQVQNLMVRVQEFIISNFVNEPIEGNTDRSPTAPTSEGNVVDRDGSPPGGRDIRYSWNGVLPPRNHKNPIYSCKVFLGGLPWDITEGTLVQAFKPFGLIKIEWPGKEGFSGKPKGYAYAVFENEKQVKILLQNCIHDYSDSRSGKYYFKVTSKKFRGKDVQIIPWTLNDSNFVRCQASKIDPLKTVFVGALHGMINAEGLATIMNDLFDNVIYAGIDMDKTKYPIGSARVTFNNTHSYMKAVTAAFIYVKTPSFDKKLQLDPYLEDAVCSSCKLQQGPYFCRDTACFNYFCRSCFHTKHAEAGYRNHRPMMRTTHRKPQFGFSGTYQQSYANGNNFGNNSYNGHNHGNTPFNNNNNNNNGGQPYHNNNNNNCHSNNGYNHHQHYQPQNGFGGHHYNRQWNNNNNNGGNGRCIPANMHNMNPRSNHLPFNGHGSGGPCGVNKFNNCANSVGGQCAGGNNLGNGLDTHTQGQSPFGNNGNNGHRNSGHGPVGHRQQQQFTRW